jgi:ABC-type branched-subunit amino acid transport system ATPase component
MTELVIDDLQASVAGKQILHGVTLTVRSGEVHAVMGPNGSGKSTLSNVLMGRPGYEVTGGTVTLDGIDLLALPTWERAQAGLFLAQQYPTEVPGVAVREVLSEALVAAGRSTAELESLVASEAERIGLSAALLDRAMNVDLSGGEKKRNETVQLAVLQPRIAVLDELTLAWTSTPSGTSPGASSRPPTTGSTAARRSAPWSSRTTTGCSPSCTPTWCTCSRPARCSAPVVPSWRPSSRSPGTPSGRSSPSPRPRRPARSSTTRSSPAAPSRRLPTWAAATCSPPTRSATRSPTCRAGRWSTDSSMPSSSSPTLRRRSRS